MKQDEIILERYLNRFVSHIEYYYIFTDEQKAVSDVKTYRLRGANGIFANAVFPLMRE